MGIAVWCMAVAGLFAQVTVKGERPLRAGEVVIEHKFDEDKVGQLPDKWRNRAAGEGKPAEWTVTADASAPSPPHVLAITRLPDDVGGYNHVVLTEPKATVFNVTVKLKALSGKEDQGGGLIFRAVDDHNYYLARVNPLELNFRVYKVVDGKRTQLGTVDVEAKPDHWYTLQVISLGETFICALDRRWTLQFDDRTFPEAGLIGLWTKADAMTAFDDLELRTFPNKEKK